MVCSISNEAVEPSVLRSLHISLNRSLRECASAFKSLQVFDVYVESSLLLTFFVVKENRSMNIENPEEIKLFSDQWKEEAQK